MKKEIYELTESAETKDYIKKLIKEERHHILYNIFGIKPVEFKANITFNYMPLSSDQNSVVHTYDDIEVSDYQLLSSVDEIAIHVENTSGENNSIEDVTDIIEQECNIKATLKDVDYFQKRVKFLVEFTRCYGIQDDIIYDGSYVLCTEYALAKNHNLPIWVELLITSFAFDDIGNERMAFFTAFSALDSYIETQYAQLSGVYKSKLLKKIDTSEAFDELHI